MDRSLGFLVLGRILADVTVGAAAGFALASAPVTAALAIVSATAGLGVGVRIAEKNGRRTRLGAELLALAAAGAGLASHVPAVGLALASGAAAIAGMILGRERADRLRERPRITTTIVGLGGAAAVAHGSHLAPHDAAVAMALLSFLGALAAMVSALHVGPGRPPPRALDVAVFLGLGAASVVLLSVR